MVTTMPELIQPISWLLHACHGCYNQMCGCNNLKAMVVSTEKHGCYHANSKVVSTKLVFYMGLNTPHVLQKGRRGSCASQYDIRMMQCNDLMVKCRDIDLLSILVFLEYLSNSLEQPCSCFWNKTVYIWLAIASSS